MRKITEMLGELADVERESSRTGVPSLEILEGRLERREFLRRTAMAGAGIAAGPALLAACTRSPKSGPSSAKPSEGEPRVAVIGAGLAGLTTAYRLWQAGYKPVVYEADDRFGGRTKTLRDYFDGGQHVELCGDTINSKDKALLDLASELGLGLDNLWSYYDWNMSGINWIDHEAYSHQDVIADFQQVFPALHRDTEAAPWPTTYDSHTDAAVKLDNMTLAEWIDANVPGGRGSRFGKLVEVAYVGEYGLEVEDQSALNLMYEMGYSEVNRFAMWGNQDWKWRIRGGNDLVASTIVERLPKGTVSIDSPLRAIRKNSGGTYTLSIEQGGKTSDVKADRVVLSLPFTTLRQVDYSQAGFDDLKKKAIENLGMGTNARLYIQFRDRVWEKHGLSGDSETDLPFQETEITNPPPQGKEGTLCIYTGGKTGASYQVEEDDEPAPQEIVTTTLSQLDEYMPGASEAWNGKAYIHVPTKDEWFLGSYSCPKPGEYTSIYGSEELPQGGVHFAGEHTSINFIGFMNGAVESGERAATEVIEALGGPRPSATG